MRAKSTLTIVFFQLLIIAFNIFIMEGEKWQKVIVLLLCVTAMISVAQAIDMTIDEIKNLKAFQPLPSFPQPQTEEQTETKEQASIEQKPLNPSVSKEAAIERYKEHLNELRTVRTIVSMHESFEPFVVMVGEKGVRFDYHYEGGTLVVDSAVPVLLQRATILPKEIAERFSKNVLDTFGEPAKIFPFLQKLDEAITRCHASINRIEQQGDQND